MSLRELDPEVVQVRLGSIRDLLADLAQVGALSAVDLRRERMLRHAVERIISQLVELAVSINAHIAATELGKAPADYRDSFGLLQSASVLPADLTERLRRSVGLRNILAHEYTRVDMEIVAGAIPAAERDYDEYVRHVARWLQNRGEHGRDPGG